MRSAQEGPPSGDPGDKAGLMTGERTYNSQNGDMFISRTHPLSCHGLLGLRICPNGDASSCKALPPPSFH